MPSNLQLSIIITQTSMKHLLFACFLLISLGTQAQDIRTVYYNEGWDSCGKSKAYYYRTIENKAGSYYVASFYINGTKISEGALSKLSTDYWSYREGHWKFYQNDGNIDYEGDYTQGKKYGVWTHYYPNSKKLEHRSFWQDEELLEEWLYSLESGALIEHKKYKEGHLAASTNYKEGDSTQTDYVFEDDLFISSSKKGPEGKRTITYTYKRGKFASAVHTTNDVVTYTKVGDKVAEFYPNGKKWREGFLIDDSTVWEKCFGLDGKDTSCITAVDTFKYTETIPAPTFNVNTHLIQNLHYPEYARLRNIQGRVVIKFAVYEDGSIGNVSVSKSVHPSLDEEALRVIRLMPKWNPGMQNGKAVCCYFSQPISFKLGR